VTPSEISEILMHVSVYAGMPVAVDGFRVASKTLADLDGE